MKHTLLFFINLLIVSSVLIGCKKNNANDTEIENLRREISLRDFADSISEAPDKEISKGFFLKSASYSQGDTYFTFSLEVKDNRFRNVTDDDIKSVFLRLLKDPKMEKVVKITGRKGIGIQYKIKTTEGEHLIKISPEEIKSILDSIIQQP